MHRNPFNLWLFLQIAMGYALPAATFEVRLSSLEGSYPYAASRGPVPVDLHSALQSLDTISVRLSGLHTNGWWEGDRVENFYDGPIGAGLYCQMNTAANYADQWTCSFSLQGNGLFAITNILHRAGGGTNWDFLRDGATDLMVSHSAVFGWGSVVTNPVVILTNIVIIIDAVAPSNNARLWLTTPEISTNSLLKFLIMGGIAGQTNVVEISSDLTNWVALATNTFPATTCPVCPFIAFETSISGDVPRRFFRSTAR